MSSRQGLTSLLSMPDDLDGSGSLLEGERWRIHPFRAEFADPDTEAKYRSYSKQFTARQLRFALGTWLVVMLLFAVPDYINLGWSPHFVQLLALRAVIALCVGALLLAVRRKPGIAARGIWTTVLEGVGLVGYLLVFVLRPEIAIWTYALTPLLLIMLFVFIPNRLHYALGVALLTAALTVVMVGVTHHWPARELGVMALVLAFPIATGYASGWRTQSLQRRQFAFLQAAHGSNQLLAAEIAQRTLLQEALRIQANTDALTGLANRREYERRMRHEYARARRKSIALSLVAFDLDFFKRINDKYGHGAGDEVLRTVAHLCAQNFREMDIVARVGGEEFVVLMPHTTLHEAGHVAERFLDRLGKTDIVFEGQVLHVHATAGVAQLRPRTDLPDTLLQRADQALYAGKQAGRNRVVLAEGTASDDEPGPEPAAAATQHPS